uniref:O2_Vc6.21 prepropeptide n=1 Tax=Conus victoriae TaxID=319920 RepID=W4VSF5_CONVC
MENLIILLLVAAVLTSTQALIQGREERQKAKINFLSKRKSNWERWWEGDCRTWDAPCNPAVECCFGVCRHRRCVLW